MRRGVCGCGKGGAVGGGGMGGEGKECGGGDGNIDCKVRAIALMTRDCRC